jgi:signal transduction histidine kinase
MRALQRMPSTVINDIKKNLNKLAAQIDATDKILKAVDESLERMIFTSKIMRTLMQDLLDLAQIEKGTFTINNSYFDLTALIDQAKHMLAYLARQKDITFEVEQRGDTQFLRLVYGDERRYMQILVNFLSNALKFSPKSGKILIGLKINDVVEKNPMQTGTLSERKSY